MSTATSIRATPATVELTAQRPACVWPPKRDVLGVEISVTTYEEAVPAVLQAAHERRGSVVSCHAVHAVVTSSRDPALHRAVNEFEMVTADGQPVRWALNLLHRAGLAKRVYGPELMLRLCRAAADEGVSIYLYGGDEESNSALRTNLSRDFPALRIAGWEAPPFRELSVAEDAAAVERINASGAGLVFIGLGCPKQDWFAAHHRGRLSAVQVCVGAAFDFHAGRKRMAPPWMQRRGLEWLFRVWEEPRRLWRRYLDTNLSFVWGIAVQYVRCRTGRLPVAEVGVTP